MNKAGRILVADDDVAFLRSTIRLLCEEGYECEGAGTADEAIERIQQAPYDLLIADIKMPGNNGLRLVREAQARAAGMFVILITGYPSLDSAIEAVELPVLAYLTKPVKFDVLLQYVATAMKARGPARALAQLSADLRTCSDEIRGLLDGKNQAKESSARPGTAVSAVTIRRLASCLRELMEIRDSQEPTRKPVTLCQLVDCPQWPAHRRTLQSVVDVLVEVKRRFKSKELAQLREEVEQHLRNLEG